MNIKAIAHILGIVLRFEGLFMLIPLAVSAYYADGLWRSFAIPIFICILAGFILGFYAEKESVFYAKEGFIIVAVSWIILSAMGALPFWMSGYIHSYVDALFETISGFTTTGASILNNVQALPRSLLFWRSITHWIGGMGVLVFIMAVLPMTGGYNMHLMRAESPGPNVGKLVPKARETAIILYAIYVVITLFEFLFLYIGGMPLFDAVTTSFATAGTGGFGILNDSMASYSGFLQNTVAVFMVIFGVNFNIYYLIITHKTAAVLKSEEVKAYILIIFTSTMAIAANIYTLYGNIKDALQYSFFQVASIITTTGFSTADFNKWPVFSQTILVILMFIGACASSTGGGIKVARILIYLKLIKKELRSFVHPNSVRAIKLDGRSVSKETSAATGAFLMLYAFVFFVSVLVISLDNFDFTTNFTAVAATINNIGPGLCEVGPASNFSGFSDLSKFVLMFDMLAGRLELFPLLVLFAPRSWKR
ncbi:MAG: TrkH family potassium uptake protein [Eubacterium sp.]|nr:TrkH family potassium uptake protein [Eubacterium sp.]